MKTPVYCKNLLEIPDGLYQWKQKTKWLWFFEKWRYYGWVCVSTDKEYREFLWTSHRDYNDRCQGIPARNLTIEKNTGKVVHYMESAITMWIMWSMYEEWSRDEYLPVMKKYIQEIEHFMYLTPRHLEASGRPVNLVAKG